MLDTLIEQDPPCLDWNTVEEHGEAGWQFSAGPSMPEWPQITQNIGSNSFGTGEFIGNAWGFPDDVLFDAKFWEDWDLGIDNIATPKLDSQAKIQPEENSISPTPFPQSHSVELLDHKACVTTISDLTPKSFHDIVSSDIAAGTQRANAKPKRSRRPPGQRSALLIRASGQMGDNLLGVIPLGHLRQGQVNKRGTSVTQEMPLLPSSAASSNLLDQTRGTRYHKDTERQYRMRLNERYSDLLKALPDDLVESASGQSGRSQADKALSKIEILALAKSHIDSLEQTQAELEQESLVLRGQQDLFTRLCVGGAGGS